MNTSAAQVPLTPAARKCGETQTRHQLRVYTRSWLDGFDVLRPAEIEAAMPGLFDDRGPEERSARAYAALRPARDGFYALSHGASISIAPSQIPAHQAVLAEQVHRAISRSESPISKGHHRHASGLLGRAVVSRVRIPSSK